MAEWANAAALAASNAPVNNQDILRSVVPSVCRPAPAYKRWGQIRPFRPTAPRSRSNVPDVQDNGSLLTRRTALRAIGTGAAVAVLPALMGFAPAPVKKPAGRGVSAAPGTLVMVIRHGEKPEPPSSAIGIDLNGQSDSHSLTKVGWTRAVYLIDLFAPQAGSGQSALPSPRVIYASGMGGKPGQGTRCRQTVGPLAAQLGIPVNTSFARGEETDVVAAAAAQRGPTLICWQHGELPGMAAAFGQVSPAPPKDWPDNRYDVVWAFTAMESGGWEFAEVPQRLLPGDSDRGFARAQ